MVWLRLLKLTDVNSVERIPDERSFAHVVVFVVDLEPFHAASESAGRCGLRRRLADVLEPTEKQLSTKRHPTEQALDVQTQAALKTQDWKTQDGKMTDGVAAVEMHNHFPPVLLVVIFPVLHFPSIHRVTVT